MRQPSEPSVRQLLAYGLPALPLAALTLPFYILVPSFYARDLGLPLAAVGSALLMVRILDALSDPLIGVLADRWRPGLGRRRVWFGLACLPAAVAAWFVFVPPPGATTLYLAVWGTILSLAWTAATVPYTAWGAEMSVSYAGRARVAGFRETFGVAGTLLALSAQSAVPAMGFPGQDAVLLALALFVGAGVPLAALLTITTLPEPPDASTRRIKLSEGAESLVQNGPFLRLLAAFFLNGCANGFPATLFLFFVTDQLQAGPYAGPLLFVYFLAGIAGVPAWLWLARRESKHRAWVTGMALACLCFAGAPFLSAGDVWAFGMVCIGTGLALGADLVLAPSIQADVIDVDTARTGTQRAGLYFALWGFSTKLALAVAVGIAFPLLSSSGFDPASGVKSASGLRTLVTLYAVVPIALKCIAMAIIWNFPLDAAAQIKLRAQIEARVT